MEKLRILAKNLDQKNEIINLFIMLGHKRGSFCTCDNDNIMGIHVYKDGDIQDVLHEDYEDIGHKEITIEQLKDLVVLKRNSIDDATHIDKDGEPWFVSGDNKFHSWADDHWAQERENVVSNYNPKPIEKPMKEYLNKETHEFVGSHSELNDMWIEIPEGKNIAWLSDTKSIHFTTIEMGYRDCKIVWQRHPEKTLNDKVASAEAARQESKEWDLGDYDFAESDALIESNVEQAKHNHYYINVSNVDEVDFYEIALRYNVTDPCIQHILKKCLAVGGRGHKDFHTDLKDIYDTAKRALDIHKVDQ